LEWWVFSALLELDEYRHYQVLDLGGGGECKELFKNYLSLLFATNLIVAW
jgi:hypothetical protein